MNQADVFFQNAADRWFERNRHAMSPDYLGDQDPCLRLVIEADVRPKSCLEIGAANGFRPELFRRFFGCRGVGIEPSEEAISNARDQFPHIEMLRGLAHELGVFENSSFDLVMIPGVLHVVSREHLLATVAESDRVLSNGGYLLIADFFPDSPQQVRIHHNTDCILWTYKTDYPAIWLATGIYTLVAHQTMDYRTRQFSDNVPSEERFAYTLLRKIGAAGYREVTLPASLQSK